MLELRERYSERPTRFVELWEHEGWRLKVYEIAYNREHARPELIEAAKERAIEKLPAPAVADGRYGVGFLGVHDGRGGVFTFVDWWEDENELHHHLWLGPEEHPTQLEYVTSGLIACVFEMRVIVAEREAWIDTVLANPDGPDLDAYLARRTA